MVFRCIKCLMKIFNSIIISLSFFLFIPFQYVSSVHVHFSSACLLCFYLLHPNERAYGSVLHVSHWLLEANGTTYHEVHEPTPNNFLCGRHRTSYSSPRYQEKPAELIFYSFDTFIFGGKRMHLLFIFKWHVPV